MSSNSSKDSSTWPVTFTIVCAVLLIPAILVEVYASHFKPTIFLVEDRIFPGYAGSLMPLLLPYVVINFNFKKLFTYLLFTAIIFLIWLSPWTERKQFALDYRKIKPEMSQSEVESKMKRYFSSMDVKDSPRIYEYFKLHGNGFHDAILVCIENGKVVWKQFSQLEHR